MKNFNQEDFNKFILDNNIIGFFEKPITLNSGRQSNWYVNWRNISNDVFLSDKLVDFVIGFASGFGLEADSFYGVPEGATKFGILTQYKWAKMSPNYGPNSHALPMGRGKPKDYGASKDRYFVGEPRGKTVVLEDVTTTGNSLLKTIDGMAGSNAVVVAAIGLTNRMEVRDDGQSVEGIMKSRNIIYHAMSSALQLLPEAYKKMNPGGDIGKAIEDEFERYSVERIKLL